MSSSLAEEFTKNGFIASYNVLTTEEVQEFQKNFQMFEDDIGKEASQYTLHNVHVNHPWVLDIATHGNVLKPVSEILGPNIVLLDSRFICKYPIDDMPTKEGKKPFVGWHQDVRYWGIEGDVVTAWLAVDDAYVENGCMCVIPGTHKFGLVEHKMSEDSSNLLSTHQFIPSHLFDEKLSLPCPVKAGQMSLHHGLLIHGSEPNNSKNRRCGYVIRFISTEAKPIEDPDRPRSFPCTVLVAGEDKFGHFKDNRPDGFHPRVLATVG